jgi:hypothetical protein
LFKVSRIFFGGYAPNYQKLKIKGWVLMRLPRPIISSNTADQGFGQIKGSTKKLGVKYFAVPVCCFKRSDKKLLWETISKPDGSYAFRNIAVGLECFIIAFDPNSQYNAVIQDKVVAK